MMFFLIKGYIIAMGLSYEGLFFLSHPYFLHIEPVILQPGCTVVPRPLQEFCPVQAG